MLVTAEAQPERQQSPRQAVRAAYNMDIFLHRHQPQHMSPFAGKPVNLKSCSVRFGCIHIPFLRLQFGRWINKSYSMQRTSFASQTASNPSPQFQIDPYPEVVGRCKWNRPFTRGGQLLTLWERGSSPLAWLDEYKLTYSPSPPSSFALSLYGKRGGTQTQA